MRRIHFIQFFWVTLPATVIIFTTFLVIFGNDGLFAQKTAKEQLFYLEEQADVIVDDNNSLELRIAHIKKNKNQMYVLSSERLLAAPKGSVVYRFSPPSE